MFRGTCGRGGDGERLPTTSTTEYGRATFNMEEKTTAKIITQKNASRWARDKGRRQGVVNHSITVRMHPDVGTSVHETEQMQTGTFQLKNQYLNLIFCQPWTKTGMDCRWICWCTECEKKRNISSFVQCYSQDNGNHDKDSKDDHQADTLLPSRRSALLNRTV